VSGQLVVNVRTGARFDVYVGRPHPRYGSGPWGNPFVIGRDGDRAEVLAKYSEWLAEQPRLRERAMQELRGKVLGCWCVPEGCHAEILAAVANAPLLN
jgi:hypothetical protein